MCVLFQRWFVVHHGPAPFTKAVFLKEVDSTLWQISLAKDNESSWNYLRGLVLRSPEDVVGMDEKNAVLARYSIL
jgi:hypothetical protein